MENFNIENYAMKILVNTGCDCYTYGGERSKNILDDLKAAFPDGMLYPYIDVANAILAMSRPEPIRRSAWRVCWDTDTCAEAYGVESFEAAKDDALDTLIGWMMEESNEWEDEIPTEEEMDNWDYMIETYSVSVEKYNPMTDEYEEYWNPNDDELKQIGWKTYTE